MTERKPRRVKTTHTALRAAAAVSGDTWYAVEGTRGLWLRVRQGVDKKAWVFRSTVGGAPRKAVLGHWPDMDYSGARSAMEALRKAGEGQNPIEAARARKAAERSQREQQDREAQLKPTVGSLGKKYLGAYVSERRRTGGGEKRSAAEDRRLFEKHIAPHLGSIRLEDLKSRDIAAARDAITAPSEKRKALAVLRALLSHAKSDGLIEHNPALGIKTPQSGTRDRVLSDDELRGLWIGAAEPIEGVRPAMLGAIRLQLLTAQRAGEVLALRWQDLDAKGDSWLVPADVAKNGRENLVPLSPPAAAIIEAQPKVKDHVFPGHRVSPVSTSAFAQLLERVRVALKLEHFTSHDLRRTAATRLAALGTLPHVVEAILNHSGGTISGVAAIYNRHAYEQEKRRALNAWARELERIATSAGKDAAAVVPIRGTKSGKGR